MRLLLLCVLTLTGMTGKNQVLNKFQLNIGLSNQGNMKGSKPEYKNKHKQFIAL